MALRGLVPYAAVAVLIAVGSSAAVVSTVRPVAGPSAPNTAPSATSGAPRAAPELSRTGRIAYWRDHTLWAASIDGSLRLTLATTPDLRRVSLTRWALDGSAVAFVDAGLSLVVVHTDGTRAEVDLPIELRNGGYRIADIRWSPDATRVAATLLRSGDGRSDAFLVDLSAPRLAWSRLTTLEDLFLGDWISNDEILASTALGVVGAVSARSANTIRLIAGVQGVSPVIGPEGRIHFLVGRVSTSRDPSLAYITGNRASVWSAATDGSDMRRETAWELSDIRLDGRLPDGRYLAHRSASAAQGTITEDVELLPTNAGVIERIRVAPDGRTAFGFTAERIVRIDLAKLTATPPVSQTSAVSVFLETGGEADVWFPASLSLARGGTRPLGGPAGRSVFTLGSHVWQLEGGVAALLRPAPILRRTAVPSPRWSPSGSHVAVVEQAGSLTSSTTFVAYVIARGGDAVRLEQTQAAARSFAWSPDGRELAVVVDRRGVSGIASDAQLEIRFLDTSGRPTRAAVPGSEVAWTDKGLLVLREASGATSLLQLESGDRTRTLVTENVLAADARIEKGVGALTTTIGSLDASRDGSFASLRLQIRDRDRTRTWIVLLDLSGTPLHYVPGGSLSDLAWAPAQPYLGYTLDVRTATERAVVQSPRTGDLVATKDGRFAGWSPDGAWYYVSRITGLFAFPLAGGAEVRVGAGAAPITTAP